METQAEKMPGIVPKGRGGRKQLSPTGKLVKASLLASAEKSSSLKVTTGRLECQSTDFITGSQGAAGVSGLFPSMNFSYFSISAAAGRHEKVRPH